MDLDTIVVGAGHAGLGVSSFLEHDGREHVVLERGRIGETWRSQRWESFRLNTPNWMNRLPGQDLEGAPREGFGDVGGLVGGFERYARQLGLPVSTGVTVTAVERDDASGVFTVSGASGTGPVSWRARTVVVVGPADETRLRERDELVPPVGPGTIQLLGQERQRVF